MFATFTLIGLVFAGSALAAPPGAEPREAEREDVQPGAERGDVTPLHAPSTDINYGECPEGYHREGCTPDSPCVPDLETLRQVHPHGDGDAAPSTFIFCPPGTIRVRCTGDLDDDCVEGFRCLPLLEAE
jgi:hypothetical protein